MCNSKVRRSLTFDLRLELPLWPVPVAPNRPSPPARPLLRTCSRIVCRASSKRVQVFEPASCLRDRRTGDGQEGPTRGSPTDLPRSSDLSLYPDTPWDCHICLHWGGARGSIDRHIWQSHGVSGLVTMKRTLLLVWPGSPRSVRVRSRTVRSDALVSALACY